MEHVIDEKKVDDILEQIRESKTQVDVLNAALNSALKNLKDREAERQKALDLLKAKREEITKNLEAQKARIVDLYSQGQADKAETMQAGILVFTQQLTNNAEIIDGLNKKKAVPDDAAMRELTEAYNAAKQAEAAFESFIGGNDYISVLEADIKRIEDLKHDVMNMRDGFYYTFNYCDKRLQEMTGK